MKLTENFEAEEFQCPCCHKLIVDAKFISQLQDLRNKFGRPLPINSGYRCEEHNRHLRGAMTSRHLLGEAVDISTVSYTSSELYDLIRLAMSSGFTGIGIGKTFIHLDARKSKSKLWVY